MHPEVLKPAPGKCPKCGMDLVPVDTNTTGNLAAKPKHDHTEHAHHINEARDEIHAAHSAHDKHAGHHTQDFLKRFWICLALTIPVLLLSHMIQQWMGFELKFT